MALESPLLGPGSFLDERRREVIRRVSEAERAGILALPSDDPLDAKRRRRVEATLPEMMAQPAAVEATWARNADGLAACADAIAEEGVARVLLVGAGDSLAVMIAARMALEAMLGVPCEPLQSLEFAYYAADLVVPGSLVVALSSSGETTRTIEAVLVAQHCGAMTLGLTNTPGSTLDRECDATLMIEATRVGWPTQSSTAALALLLRLAAETGARLSAPRAEEMLAGLGALPGAMSAVLEAARPFARAHAAREADGWMYLFGGGGPNLASAIVGAAKVKECTPDHALAIQVEEYHHYNSQKAGEPLVLFAPAGPSVPRARDTASEARRFGGRAYAVTSEGERALDGHCEAVLHLPAVAEELSPLLHFLPAQAIGYELAMAKFAAAEAAARG